MRKDIVEILQYAKAKLKIPKLAILTNGLLLTNSIANKIKPYVDILSISIDGFSKEKPTFIRDPGIFDRICNAIMICKAIGIRINIIPTIHEKNIEYMSQYVDFANRLGVEISFSILTCPPENMLVKEFIPSNDKLRMLGKGVNKLGDSAKFADSPMDYSFSVRKSCEVCKYIISIVKYRPMDLHIVFYL
jgi:MoaA/NifB/PqqE/SkfB family radical SAM enzyme